MYNKDVLDVLVKEFGVENTILYCKMETRKSQIMLQDSIDRGQIGSSEWSYEVDFWQSSEKELSQNKTKKDEQFRVIAKLPKNITGRKTMVSKKNA